MMYVAALLLGAFAGSIPALANSPLDPRTREMEPRIDPVIEGEDRSIFGNSAVEGEDQNIFGNPDPESHPIEAE